MTEPTFVRVRVCTDCGETGSSMDTVCQSCLRRGTLRDGFQCAKCRRISDEAVCIACEQTGFREGLPAPQPRIVDSWEEPRIAKSEPPAWAIGAVGGAFFGAGAGAVAAMFLGEIWYLGAGIGVLPGIIVGALLTRNTTTPT